MSRAKAQNGKFGIETVAIYIENSYIIVALCRSFASKTWLSWRGPKQPLVKTPNGIEEKVMLFAVLLQCSEASLAISFTTRVECSDRIKGPAYAFVLHQRIFHV